MARKVVIVGGVAGGASAAARLRRLDEGVEIVLFEQGEYVSFANCGLPYYIGGVIAKRSDLLIMTPAMLSNRFRIDVRTLCEVTSIDRRGKYVEVLNHQTETRYTEPYDELILSPGAAPSAPPIPGAGQARVFTLRNLQDTDRIKAFLQAEHPKYAVVVGGGFIGLEMAENLVEAGVQVTLAEFMPQVLPPLDAEMAAMVHQELRKQGITLRLGLGLKEIQEEHEGVLSCGLSDGSHISTNMIIMAVGVRPDNKLAAGAGLELGPGGSIVVDALMHTSDPNIYAVGDATSFPHFVLGEQNIIALAGPANRQGRLAAGTIAGRLERYQGTQGTAVVKVFSMTVGSTGANEKQLKAAKWSFDKVYVHPNSHAAYYPGSTTLSIKLLFDSRDGKVLGAQAVGHEGVDKRIDVLATAIRAGMTVFDLENLELSYAPPYSSAKDPVNMAGFTAANVLKGDFQQCFIEDLAALRPDQDLLVDVRTPGEYKAGSIGSAINIPLDEIRKRLSDFPRDKRIVIFCRAGLRGYVACRILMQHGFERVVNLSGGYLTWEPVFGKQEKGV